MVAVVIKLLDGTIVTQPGWLGFYGINNKKLLPLEKIVYYYDTLRHSPEIVEKVTEFFFCVHLP